MEHHKLDAYNFALDFVPRAHSIAGGFSRGLGDLADQLRRASTSIALNIAEGAGEYAPKDKAKFYRFAKRSAAECAAVIEIAAKLGPGAQVRRGREATRTAHSDADSTREVVRVLAGRGPPLRAPLRGVLAGITDTAPTHAPVFVPRFTGTGTGTGAVMGGAEQF